MNSVFIEGDILRIKRFFKIFPPLEILLCGKLPIDIPLKEANAMLNQGKYVDFLLSFSKMVFDS